MLGNARWPLAQLLALVKQNSGASAMQVASAACMPALTTIVTKGLQAFCNKVHDEAARVLMLDGCLRRCYAL